MGRLKDWYLEQLDARGERDFWEEPPWDTLSLLDDERIDAQRKNLIHMTTSEFEFRYERRGDEFVLRRWYSGTEKSERSRVEFTPEWLKPILDVARVSGHLKRTVEPPPDEILWFRTDRNYTLTTFIDLEDPR